MKKGYFTLPLTNSLKPAPYQYKASLKNIGISVYIFMRSFDTCTYNYFGMNKCVTIVSKGDGRVSENSQKISQD